MARLIAKNIMKNIHVLPTEKPSRLAIQLDCKPKYNLQLSKIENDWTKNWEKQNIYITNDEQIKVGDFFITKNNTLFKRWSEDTELGLCLLGAKKIILTTDQDLIKYGVQAIDDEFLEWFVKNPSCEFVEVKPFCEKLTCQNEDCNVCCQELKYKIIIPKQESKQETLEEVAENHQKNVIGIALPKHTFIAGAKWQQEQDKNKYSEEEVEIIIQELMNDVHCGDLCCGDNVIDFKLSPKQWFEQFKNK